VSLTGARPEFTAVLLTRAPGQREAARKAERRREWYRAVASGGVVNALISKADAAHYLDVLAMLE